MRTLPVGRGRANSPGTFWTSKPLRFKPPQGQAPVDLGTRPRAETPLAEARWARAETAPARACRGVRDPAIGGFDCGGFD